MKHFLIIVLIITVNFLLYSEELKELTFEQVYMMGKGEKLLNELPRINDWANDRAYYEVKKTKLLKVDAKSGKTKVVLDSAKYPELKKKHLSLMRAADKTKDYSQFLFKNKKGDIFLFSRGENKLIQVTQTEGEEKNPTFSPDGSKIAYTLEGNLYVYSIPGNKTRQLTTDGSEEILNGYASWIYYEEILGRRSMYKAFWWSPDSTKIVFMQFDQSKVPIFPIVRSTGDYGELEKQRYPKPGYPNPTVKIGIADLKSKDLQWIDCIDEEDHYLTFPKWNSRSNRVFFQWMNRDQNHLKILCFDLSTKKTKLAYEEKQKAWIDFLEDGDLWILSNDDLVLRSSKSGWFHIYYVTKDGTTRPVTSGDWTVNSIKLATENPKQIYFLARKEASTETDFYRTDFSGKRIKRLTSIQGSHRITLSPGGSYFIDTYSSIQFPAKMELKNKNGKLLRKLGDAASPVMKKYKLAKRELFTIKSTDGYNLPATWFLPPDFDRTKKYPVIFTIYGAPGASTVSNYFGYRGLGNYYLAQQGIIIFSVDHRGSGHFGKKGIDLMHRSLGKWEMVDYIEAVKYLRTLPFIDSKRIGITGGSYGGYVTALALTYGSEYFQYGIAGASVTDWRLYDTIYTERYMGTPQDNPEGYKHSSVLTHIKKLKDNRLLITHGNMDDNVHMQNTIQFIDKAQDAGKQVELMIFPGQRHGIRHPLKRITSAKMTLNFWKKNFFGEK
jgi:dipeptidyl-peptidase-4